MAVYGAFDNHNAIYAKKSPIEGKNAVAQIGTAYIIRPEKPIHLPPGTKMKSPSGILFTITTCVEQCIYSYLIHGRITSAITDSSDSATMTDINMIENGMFWPKIGFKVVYMAGFQPLAPLDYVDQIVPPSLRARVSTNLLDSDMVLSRKRKWPSIDDPQSEPLTAKRYQSMVMQARRIIDLAGHCLYLKKLAVNVDTDADDGFSPSSNNFISIPATPVVASPDDARTAPPGVPSTEDERQKAFMRVVANASTEIDGALKFQSVVVKNLNPKVGRVDKFFAFPIIPFAETSKSDMVMVLSKLAESMQLISIDIDGRCTLNPNALDRRVNLRVDALSSRNFAFLRHEITRRLAQLGSAAEVLPMLDALKSFTVEHDYLHDNRMHKQDCIWRQYYGCFLQPFQLHLGWKNITGEPAKRKMQAHEEFLSIQYKSLRQSRLTSFIRDYVDLLSLETANNSPEVDLLLLDSAYLTYCDGATHSFDEPTRVCALFMKVVESYFRCVFGTKMADFYLLEQECIDWLPAFHLCGKGNYVNESARRTELLYGGSLTNFELEGRRLNRVNHLMEDGPGISFDEINEYLNAWNKSSVMSPDFNKVCVVL